MPSHAVKSHALDHRYPNEIINFVEIRVLKEGGNEIHIDGLVQYSSNSIANALALLQSCTKPSIWLCDSFVNKNSGLKLTMHYFLSPTKSYTTKSKFQTIQPTDL